MVVLIAGVLLAAILWILGSVIESWEERRRMERWERDRRAPWEHHK